MARMAFLYSSVCSQSAFLDRRSVIWRLNTVARAGGEYVIDGLLVDRGPWPRRGSEHPKRLPRARQENPQAAVER